MNDSPEWNPKVIYTWNKKQLDSWVEQYGEGAFWYGEQWFIRSKKIASSSFYKVWWLPYEKV